MSTYEERAWHAENEVQRLRSALAAAERRAAYAVERIEDALHLLAIKRMSPEDKQSDIGFASTHLRSAIAALAASAPAGIPTRGDLIVGRCVHQSQPVTCRGECDTNCPMPAPACQARAGGQIA